jgi:plastocyanin
LKAKVVASLPLLGPNETAELTFAAPETPGRYTYLCTFPAHCAAGMRGVLVVR